MQFLSGLNYTTLNWKVEAALVSIIFLQFLAVHQGISELCINLPPCWGGNFSDASAKRVVRTLLQGESKNRMENTRSPYSFFWILHIALALICLYSVIEPRIRHLLNTSSIICICLSSIYTLFQDYFYREILTSYNSVIWLVMLFRNISLFYHSSV